MDSNDEHDRHQHFNDINPINSANSREWVSDDALASLATERQLHEDETEEGTARRLMRENVGVATLSIIHLATHGSNDRLRLDASKYIVERVLGRVGDDAFGDERSPLENMFRKLEEIANSEA